MSVRDDIFFAIRAWRAKHIPVPPSYRPPASGNLVQAFAERAQLANAEVRFLDSETDVPQVTTELLRACNMAAAVHVPSDALALPWEATPGLTLKHTAPGADDAAIAIAPFGIAETGTLAYAARADSPASWHFRAGFEIAVIHAGTILPYMEDVIAHLKSGGLPSTVNFVTGPSRTGDIEQTLELGAHGPKSLAILIVVR